MIIGPTDWVSGLGPSSGFRSHGSLQTDAEPWSWSSLQTAAEGSAFGYRVERRGRTIDRKSRYYKSVVEDSLKSFQCVFFIASSAKLK